MSDGMRDNGRDGEPYVRTCDRCGKRNPDPQPVKQRAAHKATAYMIGTFYWCKECRREANGTWKHA